MTYGKYITNASICNTNLTNAHDKLIEEWGKGSISYPRSNGKNHPLITIEKPNIINREVKNLLEMDITKMKKSYKKVNKNTIYYIVEQLHLSSPSSLIKDVTKALKIKKRQFEDKYLKKMINFFKNIEQEDEYIEIKKVNLRDIIKLETKKLNKKLTKNIDIIR